MIVSGKVSVKAILQARKRDIACVYILDKHQDKESRYIEKTAVNIPVQRLSREEMDALAGNQSHGGYLIDCSKRHNETVSVLPEASVTLMFVEGVTDPFNLGEICRSIRALGYDGIITPSYDFYEHEAKLIRASAGASEDLWWHQTSNIQQTVLELKQQGIFIAATHRHETSISLLDYVIPQRVCFCLGGAYRGLSRAVLDGSDVMVRIDYNHRIALSSVGASNVIAYETYRQRREKE